MTMTTKIPLTNCFQKFCLDTQSLITNTRLWLSWAMALMASGTLRWRAAIT